MSASPSEISRFAAIPARSAGINCELPERRESPFTLIQKKSESSPKSYGDCPENKRIGFVFDTAVDRAYFNIIMFAAKTNDEIPTVG
ncbi:MAG: hypothetical protein LBD73_08820 [Deferribacteraceae bacterium]|nr:hypothetical protein [Deferribacteraceae bacterium]